MKKIAFLGCENSHAATFLNFIKQDERFRDIEVAGVYSHDEAAAQKLGEKFGVPVMKSYDEAAGKADGVVVTARHGDNHYKYAKPYLVKGMTVFIDKPVTIGEDEAVKFMQECKESGVKVTGGSSLRYAAMISRLKRDAAEHADGETLGGFLRCPISLGNPNGGFFFYAQHLVESVGEIFGRYPKTVYAQRNGKTLTVIFRYEKYCATGVFVDESYRSYYAARITENAVTGGEFTVDAPCFLAEFEEFYDLLSGGAQRTAYRDFIAPVFVMNAIARSMESGREEAVREFEV